MGKPQKVVRETICTVGELTLAAAFDYAIGRRTYVAEVANDITRNVGIISRKGLGYMIEAIDRRWSNNDLGDTQDRDQWLCLRTLLENSLEKRL